MIKKAVFLAIVVLLLGFFYNFAKQISDSMQVSKRLDAEAEELVNLQKENTQLKKQLTQSLTSRAIEEIARDKLSLSRPGETVMIISPDQIDRLAVAQQEKTVSKDPNWQGWLRLFWR